MKWKLATMIVWKESVGGNIPCLPKKGKPLRLNASNMGYIAVVANMNSSNALHASSRQVHLQNSTNTLEIFQLYQ